MVKDLSTTGNLSYQSTIFFKNKFENSKTSNGSGIQKKPFSLLTIEPGLNPALEHDFGFVEQVTSKSNRAALVGSTFENRSNKFKTQARNFRSNLDRVNEKVVEFFEEVGFSAEDGLNFGKGGYITVIILAVIGFILAIILIVIVFCMTKSQECFYCKRCSKYMLIILGLIILTGLIGSFLLMIGSSSVSSFCGLLGDINEGDFTSLNSLDPAIDPEVYRIIKTCFDVNMSGNLYPVITSNSTATEAEYEELIDLVDGVSYYNQYSDNKSVDTNLPNLTKLEEYWDQRKLGDQ